MVPLREGPRGAVLGPAVGLAAKLPRRVCLPSSGLVLVTDAIAGMGLAPGRHTLGQQVVEIDGLNTYIAGKCLLQKSLAQHCHSCPVPGELSTPSSACQCEAALLPPSWVLLPDQLVALP